MEIAIITIFIIGYAAIALEHPLRVNKAATALLTGVLCWTVFVIFSSDKQAVEHELIDHLGEVSGILFFLLGAMTLVELIDANDGFQIITEKITTNSTVKLMWIVSILAFFLSAALDNLTTTIVMVTMLRKITDDREQRLLFAGLTIIAANAGGAWSPIGDVTTTMLWIGGQVTTLKIIAGVFLPSVVCMVVPLAVMSFRVGGTFSPPQIDESSKYPTSERVRNSIFSLGVAIFIFVPIFKTVTHLPPFMGMLLGLGTMWLITELIRKRKHGQERESLSVADALRAIDAPSILFFLGILISIAALQSTGLLSNVADAINTTIGNQTVIILAMGLLSSIVDNVPLVAAAQGMYNLEIYPTDSYFWEFLAYATGTGGSALIIGSAAGVAAMGIEQINFFWYVKRISWLALLGYFAGAVTYIAQHMVFG
jgi:Na+/H+ antiporter NhaD/arsenite permease-like protein